MEEIRQTNRQIIGRSQTVRDLLSGKKYTIDYYQREFKWGEKQIKELVNDLVSVFYESHEENHVRKDVANYGHYFLGSIIISSKSGQSFIIDGQQRLTSLTLLLIYLNNLQKEKGKIDVKIDELIYSEKYGEKSFNLNIEERGKCMERLFETGTYDNSDELESIQNIARGYEFINEAFPDELTEHTLPFFIDWLIDNVILVEITAYSDQDAYRVFETMNDRGLSLTPTEMLKGYLLSCIRDERSKTECNRLWKTKIKELIDIEKDEDADCIKAWLRSQFARSIRERKRGATPMDYDRIGTEFHRWVRENEELIGLDRSEDFSNFIECDFDFYSKVYLRLQEASRQFTEALEMLYYIAQIGFTLHYQVLLAPLLLADSDEIIKKKIKLTSIYLDIMLHRRLWNYRSIDYSTMSYNMFNLMKDIRGKTVDELAEILQEKLNEETETFRNSRYEYHLQMMNRKHVRNILARMISFVEVSSGINSHYLEYMNSTGKKRYEIEHIWADKPERHQDEFDSAADFDQHRNLIGGLLLLPKSFNASYGDLDYEKKLPHYYSQNILAKSLNENSYDHNPGFEHFIRESGLSFQPYSSFNKLQLLERQNLYKEIAEMVWNPKLLEQELESQ